MIKYNIQIRIGNGDNFVGQYQSSNAIFNPIQLVDFFLEKRR